MKFGTMSDPHFHAYKNHSTIMDGVNSRLLDVEHAWKCGVSLMLDLGCELLLVPGDIFQVRGSMKPSTYNRVFALMEWTTERLPMVMIPGNHDMEDFRGGATAIDCFRAIDKCYVAGKPSTIETRGLKIACIPYCKNIDDFTTAARGICDSDTKAVLIHQGFDDFCQPGMPGEGFSVKLAHKLFGDRWVLAGHYHTPRRKGRCIQVGAPLQHTFGDEGMPRGCWVIDLGEDVAESARASHHGLPAPAFCTLRTAEDAVTGQFIRIKAPTIAEGEKLAEGLTEATDVVIQLEREFTTYHEETIELSTPEKMLAQYMELKSEYKVEAAELMELFKEVCLD